MRNRTWKTWHLVAVIVLPALTLVTLEAALNNPAGRLNTVKAAIVNEDQGATVQGKSLPLGRELAASLVSGRAPSLDTSVAKANEPSSDTYAWEITTAQSAKAGLEDGTYGAVVTIPKDFSAKATSFAGGDAAAAQRATVQVATPKNGQALDQALTQLVTAEATQLVSATLTGSYVDQVLGGLGSVGTQLGQAVTASGQLASGATQAGTGATKLASGAGQLASGAAAAASGAGQVASGAGTLATGASQAGTGAKTLAGGAGTLHSGLKKTAAGAKALASGTQALAKGVKASAAQAPALASGASTLSTGVASAATGAGTLASGASTLSTGVASAASGASELASGASQLASGAGDAATGAGQLYDGLKAYQAALPAASLLNKAVAGLGAATDTVGQVSTQLTDLADSLADACAGGQVPAATCTGLAKAAATLGTVADGLKDGTTEASDSVQAVSSGNDALDQLVSGAKTLAAGTQQVSSGATSLSAAASQLSTGMGQLKTGAAGVSSGAATLSSGMGQLKTGAATLSTGVAAVSTGMGTLQTSTAQLATGAKSLSGGVQKLSKGSGTLATGAKSLSSGVNQVASGAGTLASGASQVSGGVDQLASGAGSLKSGADSLSTGVGQLGSGATQLASGLKAGVAQVPTYTSDQAAKLASVVAEPVALPILSEGGSGNSYAPLFCVIALWLGALALTLVFRQVPRGALASTRGSVRLTLRALAAPAAVSVVTGVACGLILAAAVGVGVGGWFACAGLGALVSLCFLAVHQGFIAWLGNTGRVISLLLAVLSLAAGVVSTSPAALRSAADFLALGQARGALLGVVSAGAGGVGSGIAAMALWLVGGLVLAVLATARHRRARASDLVAPRPAPALATAPATARRPGRGPAMGGRFAPATA